MRRAALSLAAILLLVGGYWVALALGVGETTGTVTASIPDQTIVIPGTQTVLTYTIPTVTETVTVEQPPPPPSPPPPAPPPPPPPPPPPVCTRVLSPGGDLQAFVSSLTLGDIGCLHGGSYSGSISFNGLGPKTLRGYPGESAVLSGSLSLSGTALMVDDFTVQDSPSHGIQVSGSGDAVVHMTVHRSGGSNILLHTDACHTLVTRNFVTDAGFGTSSNQYHGIYVEGCFETVTDNLTVHPSGYGIQVYDASDHDIVVSENTAVDSVARSGFVVQVAGSNIVLVNDIAYGNTRNTGDSGGYVLRQCGSGCVFDHLLGFDNGSQGQVTGALAGQVTNLLVADPLLAGGGDYHLLPGSPAIDWSNPAYVFSPDLDGVDRPQGAAGDSGAYER